MNFELKNCLKPEGNNTKSVDELIGITQTYKIKMNNMKTDLDLALALNKELQNFKVNLIAENSELKAKSELRQNNFTQDIKELNSPSISSLTNELNNVKNQNKILMLEMESLVDELKETFGINEELTNNVTTLNNKLENINEEYIKLKEERRLKDKDISTSGSKPKEPFKIVSINLNISASSKAFEEVRQKEKALTLIDELVQSLNRREETDELLRKNLTEFLQEIESLVKEINDLEKMLKTLTVNNKNNIILLNTDENNNLISNMDSLIVSLLHAEQIYSKSIDLMSQLENEIKINAQEILRLKSAYLDLKTTFKLDKKKKSKLSEENSEFNVVDNNPNSEANIKVLSLNASEINKLKLIIENLKEELNICQG